MNKTLKYIVIFICVTAGIFTFARELCVSNRLRYIIEHIQRPFGGVVATNKWGVKNPSIPTDELCDRSVKYASRVYETDSKNWKVFGITTQWSSVCGWSYKVLISPIGNGMQPVKVIEVLEDGNIREVKEQRQ